jgi:hypothetical protein
MTLSLQDVEVYPSLPPRRGRDRGGRAVGNLLYVGPWVDVNQPGTVSGLLAKGYTIVTLAGSYNLGDGVSDTTKTASHLAKPLVTGMKGPR